MNHIALFEPRIHFNTGNIARTCAATNTTLHLIEPFGFEITDKNLKRAGLDYWDQVNIVYHKNLEDLINHVDGKLFLVSKFADQVYSMLIIRKLQKTITSSLDEKILVYQKTLCEKMLKNVFAFQ